MGVLFNGGQPVFDRPKSKRFSKADKYLKEKPMSNVHVSQHSLIAHKLSILRDKRTSPRQFRELVRELSALLFYEATLDLPTTPLQIETPLQMMTGAEVKEKVGLVPILRAGLGMVDGVLWLAPDVQVWHIGLYRDEHTLHPVEYYNKLPVEPTVSVCLILDPMLATGGSAVATVDILKRWGVKKIKFVGIIGAPEGIANLLEHHPEVPIYLAAVDERLNEIGYILPGLGDAGDRQFGTA
jgi:uracil phosphoribosyltransferase